LENERRKFGANWAELFTLRDWSAVSLPKTLSLLIKYPSGEEKEVPVLVRIDTQSRSITTVMEVFSSY